MFFQSFELLDNTENFDQFFYSFSELIEPSEDGSTVKVPGGALGVVGALFLHLVE